MSNSISHNYNLCQNAKNMQLYVEPQFMPKCKKKIIDSLIKEPMSLHTLMNTPLCIEFRQGHSAGIGALNEQHVSVSKSVWQWGG